MRQIFLSTKPRAHTTKDVFNAMPQSRCLLCNAIFPHIATCAMWCGTHCTRVYTSQAEHKIGANQRLIRTREESAHHCITARTRQISRRVRWKGKRAGGRTEMGGKRRQRTHARARDDPVTRPVSAPAQQRCSCVTKSLRICIRHRLVVVVVHREVVWLFHSTVGGPRASLSEQYVTGACVHTKFAQIAPVLHQALHAARCCCCCRA